MKLDAPITLSPKPESLDPQPLDPPRRTSEIQIFTSTFLTIFCAEIGDKTQLTTLLMSAESHAPWIVFAGAGTALVMTSLLGVLAGRWLAQHISPRTLEKASGGILLAIAATLIWEIIQI